MLKPFYPLIQSVDHEKLQFICVFKPYSFRTHKVAEQQLGYVEVLSEKIGTPLWVVHRLDKETSGLMLFAKNKESAAALSQIFEEKEVYKKYYLLTDRNTDQKEFEISTFIEKVDSTYKNIPDKKPNSTTRFTFQKKIGKNNLWQAEPLTGKPHQIRLHAEKAGIPILGDHEHGGSDWFRLALHAAEVRFHFDKQDFHFQCDLPSSFKHDQGDLTLLFQEHWQSAQQVFSSIPHQECFRLIHRCSLPLQADIYGEVLWVYWYRSPIPNENELNQINAFAESIQKKLIVRHMINRGTGVGGQEQVTLYPSPEAPPQWVAEENGVKYLLKQNSGFSPGLFLDQSENRKYVKSISENKKVLNLFSYTSGFSLTSALGGANAVTTVDASSSFLDWSKENFKLNHLDEKKYEFFCQDCLLFLSGSIKRNRKWDIIVCDPPSFGRTKTTIWKIEKDLPQLAEQMWNCLNDQGQILFTCNYEKWNLNEVITNFTKKIKKGSYVIHNLPSFRFDIELPDSYSNLTKGFMIQKK